MTRHARRQDPNEKLGQVAIYLPQSEVDKLALAAHIEGLSRSMLAGRLVQAFLRDYFRQKQEGAA